MDRRGRDPRTVGTTAPSMGPLDQYSPSPLLPLPALPSEGRESLSGLEAEPVSLRPIKELVQRMDPNHPLRIVLLGEPDEMSRWEYGAKVSGWLRLPYAMKG
jgi:hypothetical protein